MSTKTFEAWMMEVDEKLADRYMVSSESLPDWDYYNAFDNGWTPSHTANQVIRDMEDGYY